MRFVAASIIFITILVACTKKEEVPIPACIQQKIDSIKQQPVTNPPIQVHAWDYGGRRVYLFTAGCCDELVRVYDEGCRYVCAPSGGISGYGDSLCADFYQAAIYKALIWKDDR